MAESSRAHQFVLLRADQWPPRDETTGGADLLEQFNLKASYEKLQAQAPPAMISGTSYLAKIVGDSELRKGPGMDLASLATAVDSGENLVLRKFDTEVLKRAFTFGPGDYSLDESCKGEAVAQGEGEPEDMDPERLAKKMRKKEKKEKKEKKKREKEEAEIQQAYAGGGTAGAPIVL